MAALSSAVAPKASAGPRVGYGKPVTGRMLSLLRAVDRVKPYMSRTREAQAEAWKRVKQMVSPSKPLDVAARFMMLTTLFRNGKYLLGEKGNPEYALLAKLVEDMGRCERMGVSTEAREPQEQGDTCEGAGEEQQDAEESGERRRSKRLHESVEDAEDAPSAKARRTHKKQKATPPKREVDAASDEQFVGLLLEHTPHLAEGASRDQAWQRVGDGLPVDNALWGRQPHGLKIRFKCLERRVTSSTANKMLPPALQTKLLAYLDRVNLLPAQPVEEDKTPDPNVSAATRAARNSSTKLTAVCDNGAVGAVGDRESAVIALVARVQKDIHREMMQRETTFQRAVNKRLDEVTMLLQLVQQDKKEKDTQTQKEKKKDDKDQEEPALPEATD